MKNLLLMIALIVAATTNFFGQKVTELSNKNNFRLVVGTIGNQSIKFVFDTGANRTVLTPQAAKRLKLNLIGSETINTARGEVKAKSGIIEIDIDGHKATVNVLIADFAAMRGIEAILGTDFLQNYSFLFDSEKNTICFDCEQPKELFSTNGRANDGRFQIPVTVNNSTKLFLVDTGASELTIFQKINGRIMNANFNNFSDDIYKKVNFKIVDNIQILDALFLPPSNAMISGLLPAKFFKKLYYNKERQQFYLYL